MRQPGRLADQRAVRGERVPRAQRDRRVVTGRHPPGVHQPGCAGHEGQPGGEVGDHPQQDRSAEFQRSLLGSWALLG